jgi:diaminopimelate decarboxylase
MYDNIIVYVNAEFEENIVRYLKNRENDLDVIGMILSDDDLTGIRAIAEEMSEESQTYGFDWINTVGIHIKKYAENGDKDKIQRMISSLKNYLSKIKIIMEAKEAI